MSSAQPLITPQELYPVNDLTRSCNTPGHLDYHTYRQYLASIGHVKLQNATSVGVMRTGNPQNTVLQSVNGDRQDNMTDFRADQALWSIDNLPHIIYEFDQPAGWLQKADLREPPSKSYAIYNRHLRDIPVLPDHISSKVEGWRLESWTRFDPRIGLRDIVERMNPNHRPINNSAFQMRAFRFRNDCSILGWVVPGKIYDDRKRRLLLDLANANVSIGPGMNTTRGLSWGLIDPSQGENGGRVAVPEGHRTQNTVEVVVQQMLQPLVSTTNSQPQQLPTVPAAVLMPLPLPPPPPPPQSSTQVVSAFAGALPSTPNNQNSRYPSPPPVPMKPSNMSVDDSGDSAMSSSPASLSVTELAPETVTVMYHGQPLPLVSHAQRVKREEEDEVASLMSQFHPYGSEGRRRQLAYILDPARLQNGFVDNRGHSAPVGYQGCTEQDIIYRDDT